MNLLRFVFEDQIEFIKESVMDGDKVDPLLPKLQKDVSQCQVFLWNSQMIVLFLCAVW